MTETEKTTGAYAPYSGNVETEETRAEKVKKQARDKFKEVKEGVSEQKEHLSKKLTETAEETRRAAREAGDKAKEAGAAVYDAISENLFPTILTGIGVAWLTASIIRSRSESDLSPQDREEKHRFADRAKELGGKAKEIGERAKEGAHSTKIRSKEIVTKNTFFVAGALAAVGMLVGLAFPETRREHQLLDELRDEVRQPEATSKERSSGGSQETKAS